MARNLRIAAFAIAAAIVFSSAQAQTPAERERAQLRQMQQQLQKLQQDNTALQKERTELEGRLKDADKTKGELQDVRTKSSREATHLRQELDQAKADLARVTAERDKVAAEREKLASDLATRDTQLQAVSQNFRATQKIIQSDMDVLSARLKLQSESADACLVKQRQTLVFGSKMIDRYEADRLRLCEPFTGLYKVHSENEIQALRDQLDALRLPDKRP